MPPAAVAGRPLTRIEWLVCVVAGLGFAFDLYESLMTPLIVGPALVSLAGLTPGTAPFNTWVGWFFFVPVVTGGICGLFGGYLTDRFGRRRVLVWSILLYSVSAAAAAHSTSLTMLLILRCTTMAGVCVEAVAAVAWLAELFPSHDRRERILSYTQACYPIGGIMVSIAYYLSVTYGHSLPPLLGTHDAWRYTLLSGLIPAFPLMVCRPFLPESRIWQAKRDAGTLRRPSLAELLRPGVRVNTMVMTLATAATLAIPFGALQQTPRIVPGIVEPTAASPREVQQLVSGVFLVQEIGSVTGRFIFAAVVLRIASRRRLLQTFIAPAIVVMIWTFFFAARGSLIGFAAGAFLGQALFNGLHSFWGNYLPRMFPTHLRGTGESVAMNLGGRVIAVSATLLTTQLANVMPASDAAHRLSYAAGTTALLALFTAALLSRRLEEPQGEQLPD
jgi:MFS family permease